MDKHNKSNFQFNNLRHKIIGVPLQKGFKKLEDGSLITRGLFTSDNKDEVGDVITKEATKRATPKYKQWGNIRYMHQPRPVGIVLRMGEEDGLKWNEVEIKVIDPQAVFEVEQGLLKALSVGILVNPDDAKVLKDGGLQIEDYMIAEISLVDHPANYDARLLRELPVDQGLDVLVRQYGLDAIAESMLTILDREKTMPDMTEPKTEAVVDEQLPETETEEIAEKAVDDPSEEKMEEEPEDEMSEEEPTEEETAEEVSLETVMAAVEAAVGEIRALSEMVSAALSALEASAEVSQTEEQTESEAAIETEASLEPNTQTVDETEPGVAVNRNGAVPETQVPEESQRGVEATVEKTDLRSALQKYFQVRNGLR